GSTLRGLQGSGANFILHVLGASPPAGLPEQTSQNIFGAITTRFQAQLICVHDRAVKGHDAGKDRGLLEDGAELRGGGDGLGGHLGLALLNTLAIGDVAEIADDAVAAFRERDAVDLPLVSRAVTVL